jgi:PTH1 family peptidyl-tRNA hydrolase
VYLIAGLGNPGSRYSRSRHNVGFMLADRLARRWNLNFGKFSPRALTARGSAAGREVLVVKPLTFMNLSGVAVAELVRYYRLDPDACLVVYDEAALPLGKIRFRPGGTSGGHRGMQSVIDCLGTTEIPRLRIGVRTLHEIPDLADYVLGNFEADEREILEQTLDRCEEGVESYLAQGMERTMALFN